MQSGTVAHWGREGSSTALLVTGVGATNAVGFSAAQSWAFWRADLTPWSESPFRCPNGKLATMAFLRTLPIRCFGAERIVALGRRALVDLDPFFTGLLPGTRLSAHIGISDRFGEDAEKVFKNQRRSIETELTRVIREKWDSSVLSFIPRGHASFAYALLEAGAALASHTVDVALVGAIDTYYDPQVVRGLIEQQRLFDLEDLDTFIPGEGAAFMLLARREIARQMGTEPLARIASAATGFEPSTILIDVPCMARGLSQAMSAVTGAMKSGREQLEWVVCDVTNENYRTHEWGLALPRSIAPGGLDTAGADFFDIAADPLRDDMLPEWFGDLGAAAMATGAVLAVESFVRGDPEPKNCLVTGSSVTSDRGAVLLNALQKKSSGAKAWD